MDKEIWLPDSKTHVSIEDGKIRIWDTIIMTKEDLNKSNFGFNENKKKRG